MASNTVQGGPQQQSAGPGPLASLATQAAPGIATAAMGSLPTALVPGVGATTAASGALIPGAAAIPATAGSGILGAAGTALGLGGTAAAGTAGAAGAGMAGMAAMAPMLAAAGPFALMALPFLLNNGTSKVPGPYGPDPLRGSLPGYNYGSKKVPGYKNGGIIEEVGEHIMNPLGIAGRALGFNNGVAGVLGEHLKNPLGLAGVAGRALGFNNGTNMAYAGGEDTVPAMLTPGEAIIPAAAAQNPNNQPMIDSMIQEGRGANAMAEGQTPQAPMAAQAPPPMAGPLSGPAQRAQVESLQVMAMKKKAFEAEEMRKQQAFEQKLALDKQKALMSMQT
jgi:hypothetical protein